MDLFVLTNRSHRQFIALAETLPEALAAVSRRFVVDADSLSVVSHFTVPPYEACWELRPSR